MPRLRPYLAMIVAAILLLTGCGSGSSAKNASRAQSVGAAPAADMASAEQGYAPPTAGMEADPVGETASAVPADRKEILNAEVEMRVEDAEEALAQLSQATQAAGGYVQETSQSGTRESGIRIRLTLRVPAEKYRSVVDLLPSLGEVQERREWSEDVTAEYVDLEARIATKEAHLAQLQKLYAQTGTISEMIQLEQEISRVTADLESMKGRYRVLSSQVALSTVKVSLYEPGVPMPAPAPRNVWERMKVGFITSWNSVISALANLAVLAAMLVPALAFLGVAGLIGYGIYRLIRRRRPPGKPPTPPAPPTAPSTPES